MCSAISCIFAPRQDLHCTSKVCKYQDILFLSQPTSKVQSARYCIFAHMQDFLYLHIKIWRPYAFFTQYMQGAKFKILNICKSARFCILAHQKCASTKTLYFHHPSHTRWKSAGSCTFAFLHIIVTRKDLDTWKV